MTESGRREGYDGSRAESVGAKGDGRNGINVTQAFEGGNVCKILRMNEKVQCRT
jgi:hypothetical protein